MRNNKKKIKTIHDKKTKRDKKGKIRIIQGLRLKNVFNFEAYKRSKVIILDKSDQYERINAIITIGPSIELTKMQLPKML